MKNSLYEVIKHVKEVDMKGFIDIKEKFDPLIKNSVGNYTMKKLKLT